jgi:hypothetical protein
MENLDDTIFNGVGQLKIHGDSSFSSVIRSQIGFLDCFLFGQIFRHAWFYPGEPAEPLARGKAKSGKISISILLSSLRCWSAFRRSRQR